MFNKKKIKALEERVASLEYDNCILKKLTDVMRFKEEAQGAKYIVEKQIKSKGWRIWEDICKISYLSSCGDKVITKELYDYGYNVKQNDKYLEFWINSEIVRAMYVEDNKLERMDIDVYKKAFADRINAITQAMQVKAGAEQATAAFEQMTSAVEQRKNTAG